MRSSDKASSFLRLRIMQSPIFTAISLITCLIHVNMILKSEGSACHVEVDGHLTPNVRDYLSIHEQVYDPHRTWMNITFDLGVMLRNASPRYFTLENDRVDNYTSSLVKCENLSSHESCRPSFLFDISKTASNIVRFQSVQNFWLEHFYLFSNQRAICNLAIVTAKEAESAVFNLEWSTNKNRLLLSWTKTGGFPRNSIKVKELKCKDQYKLYLTTSYQPASGEVSLPLGDARRYQACHLLYETTQGEQTQTVSVPRDL